MLNKRPIFINGFSYGGTNLIMNFLASHPDVCLLSGETHEVFVSKPNRKLDKLVRKMFYFPLRKAAGQDIFGRKYLEERRPLPAHLGRYLDLIFYVDKLVSDRNRDRTEGVPYTFREKKESRFLAKNVNGVVLASAAFADLYPDATFFGLVRNGFALCDGYRRRGWSVEDFARLYDTVCRRMIEDAKTLPNYRIVRFEDMTSDPLRFIREIFGHAGLDIGQTPKIRLQAKRSMNSDGTRSYTFGGAKDRELHWFPLADIPQYMRSDVDRNQQAQLPPEDLAVLKDRTGSTLRELGYL